MLLHWAAVPCLLLPLAAHAHLSATCSSSARHLRLNLTGLMTLARRGFGQRDLDIDGANYLAYLAKEAFDHRSHLLPHACPCAVAVACAWRYAQFARGLEGDLAQHDLAAVYHHMLQQEKVLKQAVPACPLVEIRWWPVQKALQMHTAIVQRLLRLAKEIEQWADSWRQEPTITDEQHEAALADVSAVFESIGLEWWPTRGTLISLLRHGKRSGLLSKGKVDVVDHDVDVMLALPSRQDWPVIRDSVVRRMAERGWHSCLEWYSTSATKQSYKAVTDHLAYGDVLMCSRKNPDVSLDIATYVTEGSIVYAQKYCLPHNLGSGCWLPHEGTFHQSRGKLRAAAIRPLGRCKAGAISVPCPRRPLEALKASLPSTANVTCIALPDVAQRLQRDRWQSDKDEWLSDGLTQEDVDILRSRALELDRQGYMSMTPYISDCWVPEKGAADLRE
ncbi:LNX2 [Symbiodinium natans]|uniref:LNX2 protein n=1 Tax=Symbiodinium natans TaxID=878477 RepID=A0A812TS47_9DINO|nr:LNX2 [Symbiodinium natans]